MNLGEANDQFKQQLIRTPRAIQYLRDVRKINWASVQRYHLGFCPDYVRELGNFAERITIPAIDHHGWIRGFHGRGISDAIEPKYQISFGYDKSQVVFGLYQAQSSIIQLGYAIIAEGLFDCISMVQNGFENTVAAPGKDWTYRQIAVLRRYTDTVLLLFDNDRVGEKSTKTYSKMFYDLNFYVSTIELPRGIKDADEALRNARLEFIRTQILQRRNS